MEIRKLTATLQKDYYGKALVKTMDNGDIVLQSYGTDVCSIVDNKFVKLWNGYSSTTMKHINDFRLAYGMNFLYKKEWDNMECEHTQKFIVKFYNGFTEWGGKTIFDNYDEADNYGLSVCEDRHWRCAYDVYQIA